MNYIRKLSVFNALVMMLISMPALAHSGDHSHGVMAWLTHLFSSVDHLATLFALALLMTLVTFFVQRRRRLANATVVREKMVVR